jgi:hypothetical protein
MEEAAYAAEQDFCKRGVGPGQIRKAEHYAFYVFNYALGAIKARWLFPTIQAGVHSATLLQSEHWWFMTEFARHLESLRAMTRSWTPRGGLCAVRRI